MMRGLFGGLVWGAILGLVMLVVASLLLPLPGGREAAPAVTDAPPPRPTVAVAPATPFLPDDITAPGTTPDGRSGAPAVPRAGSAAAVAPDRAPRTQEPAARPIEATTEPATIEPPPEEDAGPGVQPVEEGSVPSGAATDVADAPAPAVERAPAVETTAEAISDAVREAVAEALAETPQDAAPPVPVALAAAEADAGAATRAPNAAAAAFIPAALFDAVPAPVADPAVSGGGAVTEGTTDRQAADAGDPEAAGEAVPDQPVAVTEADSGAVIETDTQGLTEAEAVTEADAVTQADADAETGAEIAAGAAIRPGAEVGADSGGSGAGIAPASEAPAPDAEPAPLPLADADPAGEAPEPAPVVVAQADVPAGTGAAPAAPADAAVPPVAGAESAQSNPEASSAAPAGIGQPTGSFGRPVSQGFGNRSDGVRINRLPRVGETEAGPDDLSDEPPAAEAAVLAEGAPALDRFAAAFENPEGKPLVAVVLIDIGAEAGGIGPDALATIPFPVTVAIPADAGGAADAAAAYRRAGLEIAMIPGAIPELASPADVEVSFEVFRAAISEAVAVLEPPDAGFQSSRSQAEQVVAILDETGQGLVSFDRGLNNALGAARRAGLPAVTVSRDLDAAGAEPEDLRRALDRAAFRAQQEGAVVIVLRSRPQSVATLFAWALEGRAQAVALAPVSAVFRAQR